MADDTTTTRTDSTDTDDLKDVATGGDTTTVDLQDLADDMREELDWLRERKEQATDGSDETGESEDGGDESAEDGEDIQWPPEEYAGVEFPIRAVKHRLSLVEQEIETMDGSEFVIRKARAGEVARATDLSLEDAVETETDPRSQMSKHEHVTVQVCVEKVPPDAPLTPEGRLKTFALEAPTFKWLKTRIENFNTYGEVDLSDF